MCLHVLHHLWPTTDQVLQAVADVAVESDLLETAEALVTEGHLPLELTEQCLDEVDEVKVQVMWV